jgi:hypothetical protein
MEYPHNFSVKEERICPPAPWLDARRSSSRRARTYAARSGMKLGGVKLGSSFWWDVIRRQPGRMIVLTCLLAEEARRRFGDGESRRPRRRRVNEGLRARTNDDISMHR